MIIYDVANFLILTCVKCVLPPRTSWYNKSVVAWERKTPQSTHSFALLCPVILCIIIIHMYTTHFSTFECSVSNQY